jgi:N-acetylglucosamine-6-sulfatase
MEEAGGGEPTTGESTTPGQLPPTISPPSEDPPNILLIVSDDQPFYSANYTPTILNEIFAKGTTSSDAFLSTSLCCPSTASILTGLYAHNHAEFIITRSNKQQGIANKQKHSSKP